MSIVQNERIKLRANALDRASTACLAVGVLGPAVGFLYGVSAANVPRLLLIIGSTMWLGAAVALHLLSWRTLGGLK